MNYFTPKLIIMGQCNEDATLNEQERLWESAGDRYIAYLDSVRPRFPPGLRRIDEDYYSSAGVVMQIPCMGRRPLLDLARVVSK
jgi:hypothetical protein